METEDFKTSGYFPWTIYFFGMVLAVLGLFVILKSIIIGSIIMLVSVVILTTHNRLTINFEKKIFQDYVWILGLKHGDIATFDHIEYLFIKKSKVSQTVNSRVSSMTVRKEVYDGYIKFSEKDKIHLMTKDNKSDLINKLNELSTKLNVRIIDYSEGEPKEILR